MPQTTTMHPDSAMPWYRHYWVWIMLAPLIATVIASFVTLFLAGKPPALVVDDFGQIAMAIERDRERDLEAAALALDATVRFDDDGVVSVRMTGATPPQLRIELVHPTLEALDSGALLSRDGDGWRGELRRPDSRMYVVLTDEAGSWRLTGVIDRGATSVGLAAGN